MYRKIYLVLLLAFLNALQLLKSQTKPFQYCYCPKENGETGLLNNGILTCSVSSFNPSNIGLLEIKVLKTDGSSFGTDRVIITAGSPSANAKIISSDPEYRGDVVTVKYIKALFTSSQDNVSVYINLTRQGKIISSVGPLTFYRSVNNISAVCDAICPPKKITAEEPDYIPPSDVKETDHNRAERKDLRVKAKASDPDPPAVKAFFINQQVYPSDDARSLLRALNPGVDLNNPGKPLLYPDFIPVSPQNKKNYEDGFRKQMLTDPKQNARFKENVSELAELVDIVFTSKTRVDPAISTTNEREKTKVKRAPGPDKYEQFVKNMFDLQANMQAVSNIIDRVSSITSTALNEELTSLNNTLKLVFSNRNMTLAYYTEAKALLTDLDFLIQPYLFNNNKKENFERKAETGNKSRFKVKAPHGPSPSAFAEMEISEIMEEGREDDHTDINPNERLYYIYVFKDEASRLQTSKSATGFRVWYKAKAYENNPDKSHERRLQVPASVTSTGLCSSLLVFYFKKDNKVYKSPVAINIDNELNRDADHSKAYRLIFYLNDLKLTHE